MLKIARRHGTYVIFATTTLALAVGANLAVFTIVNALWLKPVPFPDPERLVMLMTENANSGANESAAFGWLEESDRWMAFEAVAGQVVTSAQLSGLRPHLVFEQVGQEIETLCVTSQYFRLLGQPIRGRDFTRADNRIGSEPVAIISDRLWSRAFERHPDVIGAVAAAQPFPFRIIGVAPPGFEGARRGEHADIWIPSNLIQRVAPAGAAAIVEDGAPCMVFARLHPGQTPADAKQRLVQDAMNERERRSKEKMQIVPLAGVFGTPDLSSIKIREQRAGSVVAALAGIVLLAGCATLMALVLTHYERRRRELSIRIAIGASRLCLVAQLSRELAWLVAGGTVGALLIAHWSLHAVPALSLPGGVDLGRLDLSIDWRVLSAGLLTTVLALVAASFVPVSRFTRSNLAGELISADATAPASTQRLRQTLLGVHVSATIVILVAAGLFVHAVMFGYGARPGFDIDHTVFVQVQVAATFVGAETDLDMREAAIAENTHRLKEGLRSLPGVDEVAMGLCPIGPEMLASVLTPKTVETRGQQRDLRLAVVSGSPEYLSSLGLPIVRGRALSAADATQSPSPAVVTASLARTLWPEDDPLGQTLSPGFRQGTHTIVGIVPDFAVGSLTQGNAGVVVTINRRGFGMEPTFLVRTTRPEILIEPVRKLVKDIVPEAPRVVISTGRQIIAHDLGRQRLGAWFYSGFGLVALVLGAGGVFGLVAYLAESRRREFGVRLALGASPNDLVLRGVAAGIVPVTVGAAVGLMLAALVSGVLVSLLPGLSPLDPVTYVTVAILLLGTSILAGISAAWRLRRISPGDALRAE